MTSHSSLSNMNTLERIAKLLDKAVEKFGMFVMLAGMVAFCVWVAAECCALIK